MKNLPDSNDFAVFWPFIKKLIPYVLDGNGDAVGHTLIHSHTGGIADVDIVQSGVNDNMITLTTSGDNHDIDISQTD